LSWRLVSMYGGLFSCEVANISTGVVGSDPYLAPEVYDNTKYDPRPADVWSLAIIFCCMTLRRFPWKAPRLSDNSYRLFVSPPDPDQDRLLDANRRSIASGSTSRAGSQSGPASRNPTGVNNVDGAGEHSHHSHHHKDEPAKSEPASRQSTAGGAAEAPVIKGPMRLLRLLPRETRHIVGRMLELDPKKRATMDDILNDPWVQNALVCRQEEDGVIFRAPNHTHTLQPSNNDK
jgi:serine/threonine protein kinase